MKKSMKTLLVLLTALTSIHNSFGQEVGLVSPKVLTIPINSPISGTKQRLEADKGELVVLKFTGLNPLKYKYALNHEMVSLFGEGGEAFMASFSKVGGDPSIEKASQDDSLPSKIIELTNLRNLEKATTEVLTSKSNSDLNQKITNLQSEIFETANSNLKSVNSIFDRSGIIPQISFKTILSDADITENYRRVYRTLTNYSISRTNFTKSEMAISSQKDQLDLTGLQASAQIWHSDIQSLFSDFQEVSTLLGDLGDEDIKSLRKTFNENIEEISKNIVLVNSIQDHIQTLPLDHQGENIDFIKVTLEVLPASEKTVSSQKITTYDYKVWMKGGLKIDFSAGLFISSLVDKTYITTPVVGPDEDSPLYKISEENKGGYEFGVGTTVNFTYRSAKSVNFGGSVGGYLTADQRFRLTAGPSLSLGKMKRLVFGIGIAMGEVIRLSNKVDLDGSFDLGDTGTVPIVGKFDFGHYFSFTYNLTPAKAKKD
ncbi:hypothetical protein [Algoriphagus sp. A40]|uniref:hypothetical protein n=1 Tax=Algoriphagus sp. A40 TaxID=1945863 RepID=UPI000986EF97|nr:hypothetical protein [Algoriphagus sp. A40]OOG72979.1 hypothetical protein B0E43_13695 [Algoriphagus sp. A40]